MPLLWLVHLERGELPNFAKKSLFLEGLSPSKIFLTPWCHKTFSSLAIDVLAFYGLWLVFFWSDFGFKYECTLGENIGMHSPFAKKIFSAPQRFGICFSAICKIHFENLLSYLKFWILSFDQIFGMFIFYAISLTDYRFFLRDWPWEPVFAAYNLHPLA